MVERRTVDGQLRVTDNLLDLALSLEVLEGFPGERAVDLETVDEGGNGDQAVRLDILVELVGDVLVEDDSVLGLVLDYTSISTALALDLVARVRCCDLILLALVVRAGKAVRVSVTYPCPWTTSSSASCLRLLREPFCRCVSVWSEEARASEQKTQNGVARWAPSRPTHSHLPPSEAASAGREEHQLHHPDNVQHPRLQLECEGASLIEDSMFMHLSR